jgi:hypothetical protein
MFQSLVQLKKEEHASCTTHNGKELLVMNIIKEIHDNGSCFLKKLPNRTPAQGYHYEVADQDTAIEKHHNLLTIIK